MKKKIVGIFICILFVFIPISSAIGINYEFQHNINRCNITTIWVEQTKLLASNGDSNDNFGESVSINGDYAIVGAWLDEENGEDSGSAYIFKRNDANWNEEAILIPSDSIPDVRFGHSVSIDGDYAIVGTCPGKSAYIFKRDGVNWTQQAKLTGSTGSEGCFGFSVSINGDYAIIGSHDENNYKGAAYIFNRDGVNWTQQAKLTASDGEEIDCFGISVSIDGDYAIVGAYITGSAYIFKRNGIAWIEEAKMTGMEYSFGHCVSINGDYTIVGDYNGNNDKGAAHIFKRNGTSWMKDAILIASDGEKFADFGDSVSINGEYAIVGSNDDSTINGASSGSAYIFKRNSTSWIEEAKIIASDGEQFDHFGESVSIDGNHAIIGAYWDNDNGKDSGSAYILKKDTLPNKPIITGPTSGNTGNEYDYTLNATDPDGDHVMYFVDWGDNTTEWTEYGDSGEEITLKHTWIEEGDYTIKAKAKDIYDVESNWSKFEVIIPRTRTTSYSFHWLFEHFPLLERLYKLILT
jgi:hypothetical protein